MRKSVTVAFGYGVGGGVGRRGGLVRAAFMGLLESSRTGEKKSKNDENSN